MLDIDIEIQQKIYKLTKEVGNNLNGLPSPVANVIIVGLMSQMVRPESALYLALQVIAKLQFDKIRTLVENGCNIESREYTAEQLDEFLKAK